MDNWELYYRTHKDKGSNAITGVPPLTFVSNGENLADYRIYGASGGVGDRTENLFDKDSESVSGYIDDRGVLVPSPSDYPISTYDYINVRPNTYYSYKAFSAANPSESTHKTIRVSYYTSKKAFQSRYFESNNGLTKKTIRTPNGCFYIRLSIDDNLENVMLWEGSSDVSYEPYGYKIPIVCGGATTNIYLDEPLNEGESISMSDTGVSIPTINGTNILTVDTAVQPSNMYIKYGGSGDVNQSLIKYLEYKYKFAKGVII